MIELLEIQKCKEDIVYFKETYLTNMSDLDNNILSDITQRCDKIKMSSIDNAEKYTLIYFLHKFIFDKCKNIGIISSMFTKRIKFLDKIKCLYLELPDFLKQNHRVLCNSYIESNNHIRLLTDGAHNECFTGFNIDEVLILDDSYSNKSIHSLLDNLLALHREDLKIIDLSNFEHTELKINELKAR